MLKNNIEVYVKIKCIEAGKTQADVYKRQFQRTLGYTANKKFRRGGVNMCTRNQAFEILKIVYHACDPILGHSIHCLLYTSRCV